MSMYDANTLIRHLSFSISAIVHIALVWAMLYVHVAEPSDGRLSRTVRINVIPMGITRENGVAASSASRTIDSSARSVVRSKRRIKAVKTKEVVQQAAPIRSTFKADQRAVYSNEMVSVCDQSKAWLELPGWKWDIAPNPNDTTEEFGKIVFEIRVDESGEIISLQTIEKTISPIAEKIYMESLRDLTFSKTSAKPSVPVSVGKITFIIVPR